MNLTEIDAHEQPSDEMRAEWKGYMRQDHKSLLNDPRIDDPRAPLGESGFRQVSTISKEQVAKSFARLDPDLVTEAKSDIQVIHHPLLPGRVLQSCFLRLETYTYNRPVDHTLTSTATCAKDFTGSYDSS